MFYIKKKVYYTKYVDDPHLRIPKTSNFYQHQKCQLLRLTSSDELELKSSIIGLCP